MTKPHIFTNHPWAIERASLDRLIQALATEKPVAVNPQSALRDPQSNAPYYNLVEGVAIIPIQGYMIKDIPPGLQEELDYWGIIATDTTLAHLAVREAAADPAVNHIVLDIDSPGGEVAGTQELGDAIRACAKPTSAIITDLCASGALWIASQTDHISANKTASIGSIGVYLTIDDYSRLYENVGIKVNVLSSGQYKGTGVTGAPVTDEQLKPYQELIDGLAAMFIETIATGRNLSIEDAAALATGRTWLANEAKKLNLIDTVENADAAFQRAVSNKSVLTLNPSISSSGKETTMSILSRKKTDAPTAAAVEPEIIEDAAEVVADDKAPKPQPLTPDPQAVEPETAEAPTDPQVEFAAKFTARTELYGATFAAESMAEGHDDLQAATAYIKVLNKEKAELVETVARQNAVIKDAAILGEDDPATFSTDDPIAKEVQKHVAAVGENLAKTADAYEKQLNK